jgi:hypothetical protein
VRTQVIVDGAHRLAAALAYGSPVDALCVAGELKIYHHAFFVDDRKMTTPTADAMALQVTD